MGRLIDGDHDGQPGGDAVAVLRNGGAKFGARCTEGTGPVPSFEASLIDALLERQYSVSRDDSVSPVRRAFPRIRNIAIGHSETLGVVSSPASVGIDCRVGDHRLGHLTDYAMTPR